MEWSSFWSWWPTSSVSPSAKSSETDMEEIDPDSQMPWRFFYDLNIRGVSAHEAHRTGPMTRDWYVMPACQDRGKSSVSELRVDGLPRRSARTAPFVLRCRYCVKWAGSHALLAP